MRLFKWLLVLPVILIFGYAQGFENDSLPSVFDLIYNKNQISLSITTDMRYLFNKKDDTYIPAEIRIMDGDSSIFVTSGEVRTRGHSRKEICLFPPLKIRFNKDDMKARNLADYKTLKLVNTCKHTQQNTDYLLAEFMTYKLYNIITDRSFRVQLVTVSVNDSEGKRKPYTEPAFLIEHEDQMADRQNGDIYELKYYNDQVLEKKFYPSWFLSSLIG